jgi:hypothetical protein
MGSYEQGKQQQRHGRKARTMGAMGTMFKRIASIAVP